MKTKQRPSVVNAAARKTVRVNVRLEIEAQKRLAVHCAMTGMSPGEVLTRLCEGLREFSMPVHLAVKAKANDRQDKSSCVSDSAPSPALQDAA